MLGDINLLPPDSSLMLQLVYTEFQAYDWLRLFRTFDCNFQNGGYYLNRKYLYFFFTGIRFPFELITSEIGNKNRKMEMKILFIRVIP